MLLILTINQGETSFGCWPEKAQQRVESLVGENGNANTSKNSWEKNASELSFEVNYYSGTVTFNNVVAWNEVIQSLHVEKPKLLTNKYNLFELDHGYFYDLNYESLSYRLLEEPMDRKLIILKSDAVVKISL